MKKNKPNYVSNKEFYSLLVENKKLLDTIELLENINEIEILERKQYKVNNQLGKIFIKICRGYISRPNFINYTPDRKQEMISDACFYMSKYMLNFKEERTNPFSYFTKICEHAFLQYINKHNKNAEKVQSLSYIENIFIENNLKHDEDED